jgi:glutathione reductase (NADPH)
MKSVVSNGKMFRLRAAAATASTTSIFSASLLSNYLITRSSSTSHCDGNNKGVKGEFDVIVIGAGSGGVSCAKRCAYHGAKVAIVENGRYGGTCVNVGCVPKKVMHNASHVNEVIKEAHHHGFTVKGVELDWGKLVASRDRYIERLNKIYENGLESSKVTRLTGEASFVDGTTLAVGNDTYKAKQIIIATGGRPKKLNVPGEELTIDSDGYFELKKQPKKVAVIGAGYIAVELACMLQGLGSEVTLLTRQDRALRTFDKMIQDHLHEEMTAIGACLSCRLGQIVIILW